MSETMLPALFYDGQCPLCRKEIRLLRRLARGLKLVDIHCDPTLNSEEREKMLALLHFRTPDGQWLTGVDATVAAWRCTPLGGLWAVLTWPGLRQISDWAYSAWAKRRYARLYGCRSTSR